MEAIQDFYRAAENLAPDFRLCGVERRVCHRVTLSDLHLSKLGQCIEDLEFVELMLGANRRTDELPTAAILDAACLATSEAWARKALIAILSWRWKGPDELQTARTLIREEIDRRKGAAA